MASDVTIEVEAKLVDQMSGALKAIQHEMMRLEKTTFESTKGVKNELDALKRKTEESRGAFGEMSRTALKWAAGYVSLQTLTRGIVMATEAAKEQKEANLSLIAVLEATSHAAGMTFHELEALATAYQQTTKFQDNVVMSAEGMLLQFDRIGKDVFPRALQASVDLASFMGTDLRSAAQAVGQALQDPESAGRKLRAMNILLTDAQEEQIKAFLAQNEAAKAQAMIFELLEKKVGGHAKNTVEATHLLKNAWDEMLESIGTGFAESMESAAKGIVKFLPGVDASKVKADELRVIYNELRKKNPLALPSDLAAEAQKKLAAIKAQREEAEKLKAAQGAEENKKRIVAEDKAKAAKPKIEAARKEADEIAKFNEEADKNALKREIDYANKQQKFREDLRSKVRAAHEQEAMEAREAARILAEARAGTDQMAMLKIKQQAELDAYAGNEQAITDLKAAHLIKRDELESQLREKSKKEEEELAEAKIQAGARFANAMSGLIRALGKENKAAARAAAMISELGAIASTAAGIMKAYEQGGVLGFFTGAAIAAEGAAQIATIESTISKFAKGGPVYGPSHARGGVQAELEGGEFVFSRRDVANAGGFGAMERMRQGNTNNFSPVINIQLSGAATPADGQMVADAVLRTLARNMKEIEYRGITG